MVPFLSSIVTVSLAHFMRNLRAGGRQLAIMGLVRGRLIEARVVAGMIVV
jgi:hypothetical protein